MNPKQEIDIGEQNQWTELVCQAWNAANRGEIEAARELYRQADAIVTNVVLCPDLAVLRHSVGEGKGRVISPPPNEDFVITLVLPELQEEEPDARGLKPLTAKMIDRTRLEVVVKCVTFGGATENIKKELPHLQILSPGRSGTVSLMRLFERTQYMPYHSFLFQRPLSVVSEFLVRMLTGALDDMSSVNVWVETRAAEWLGAISNDRPFMDASHLDTYFAPAFAALHPKAKFVYLHRNPLDVFRSFYSKHQWYDGLQAGPIYYGLNPFKFRRAYYDIPESITWHIHFTDTFCRVLEDVLGDRMITISADALFAQDEAEVQKLVDFTEAEIDIDDAVAHFETPYNTKLHKAARSDGSMETAEEAFHKTWERLSA